MLKYKIGDRFFLDGGESVCNEKIEIYDILKANSKIKTDQYLCICNRDSNVDGSFDNVFYSIMGDYILDNCGYVLLGDEND